MAAASLDSWIRRVARSRSFEGRRNRLFSTTSRSSSEASPLVNHTMLTWPPACNTRWITPAQHSVSSSGCGDTTSRDVVEVMGRNVAGAVSLGGTPVVARVAAAAWIASNAAIKDRISGRSRRVLSGDNRMNRVDSVFGAACMPLAPLLDPAELCGLNSVNEALNVGAL